MESPDLPDVPFIFADDPSDPTDCGDVKPMPRAHDLGGVDVADCAVTVGRERAGLAEYAWADEHGVTGAWLNIDREAFIEDVSLYA